ncbi:Uncharacterised protein [Bordetella pertussis]|nr:Uncharacterised protein [Bordetella pertussis]
MPRNCLTRACSSLSSAGSPARRNRTAVRRRVSIVSYTRLPSQAWMTSPRHRPNSRIS